MNMNNEQDKYEMSYDEWESTVQQFINAKFDLDKQLSWEQSLAKMGIYRKPKSPKYISITKAIFMAASLLFLFAFAWYLFIQTSDPAQELALKYIEVPHQLRAGEKRGAEGMAINKGRALEAYYNQQYERALSHLQKIEIAYQADANVFFQMGLCLMYKNAPDYNGALEVFAEAKRLDTVGYQDEINWYSALCLIMMDQFEQAKTVLQQVMNSPSSRKQEAASALVHTIDTRK